MYPERVTGDAKDSAFGVFSPTVTHWAPGTQDTPNSACVALVVVADTGGRPPTDQVAPFQFSTSGWDTTPDVLDACVPVATHDVGPKQSTPKRYAGLLPGVGVTVQADPFHCSMSPEMVALVCTAVTWAPTAVQVDGFAHDTARPAWTCVGPVAGVGTPSQLAPFQLRENIPKDSVRDTVLVVTLTATESTSPSAMQNVGLVQDTPSASWAELAGDGTRVVDHALPFHRSTTVVTTVDVVVNDVPTAAQKTTVGQDTEDRNVSPDVGLGTVVQAEPFHRSMSEVAPVEPTIDVAVVVRVGYW